MDFTLAEIPVSFLRISLLLIDMGDSIFLYVCLANRSRPLLLFQLLMCQSSFIQVEFSVFLWTQLVSSLKWLWSDKLCKISCLDWVSTFYLLVNRWSQLWRYVSLFFWSHIFYRWAFFSKLICIFTIWALASLSKFSSITGKSSRIHCWSAINCRFVITPCNEPIDLWVCIHNSVAWTIDILSINLLNCLFSMFP